VAARLATELDEGDPADLGARYAAVVEKLPRKNVLGGCCGTDHGTCARFLKPVKQGHGGRSSNCAVPSDR